MHRSGSGRRRTSTGCPALKRCVSCSHSSTLLLACGAGRGLIRKKLTNKQRLVQLCTGAGLQEALLRPWQAWRVRAAGAWQEGPPPPPLHSKNTAAHLGGAGPPADGGRKGAPHVAGLRLANIAAGAGQGRKAK